MVDGEVSAEEKANIASRLLMLAPPCEFNEVFTDVRVLINDDKLLQQKVAGTFARYNKEQFIQVKVEGSDHNCLITQHGDLGNGLFFCPRTKKSFKFDHLKREASDFTSISSKNNSLEPYRTAVEKCLTDYVREHYRGGPACVVYSSEDGKQLILCIEAHYNKNSTTGRWRSEWVVTMPEKLSGGTATAKGTIKIQTHIFDNGNVQLISSKDLFNSVQLQSPEQFGQNLINSIKQSDSDYQNAIGEKFKNMSSSTFKSLRKALPITGEKIQWEKITALKVCHTINAE